MATNYHADHTPGADPQSIKRGHELDAFPVRGIMMVPAAVVVAFVVGFTVVTILINYLRSSDEKKGALPAAHHQSAPMNARLERISSTDPKADYKQPRLEGLQRFTTEDPPYFRSSLPTPTGNSPHYHPEDLQPDKPLAKALGLQDYSWRGTDKKEIRMPIEDALQATIDGSLLKSASKKLDDLRGPGTKASNPHWTGVSKKPVAEGKQ